MTLIHLDTISGQGLSSEPNSYTYVLNQVITGCSELIFKSIELPIAWCNVRASSGLNVFMIRVSTGQTYTATIPELQYTDGATLCTAIGTAFAAILPSNLSCTASCSAANIITLTLTDSTKVVTSFQVLQSNLACYILGYKNIGVSSVNYNSGTGASSLAARVQLNLCPDSMIYLSLPSLRTPTTISTNVPMLTHCHIKVQCNANQGVIMFVADQSSFKQSIVLMPQDSYGSITINLYDRFGSPLVSSSDTGMFDWSSTWEAR